jgi:hypothetical protein
LLGRSIRSDRLANRNIFLSGCFAHTRRQLGYPASQSAQARTRDDQRGL